jgi:predicted amino acid racemase
VFLTLLRRRNPEFLEDIAQLHASGMLRANTFALDRDAVGANARAFAAEATRLGLTPFAMTKQIGRNPDISREIVRAGITHAVGVDLACAEAATTGGFRVGHLGHLVQIPRHEADRAAALSPLYWTVFNETKALEAAAAAVRAGRVQDVLLRVFAPSDRFYPGHEGGFELSNIVEAAQSVGAINGLRFAGITTFPATLFNAEKSIAEATPNRATLQQARERLEAAGHKNLAVNAPGTTSISVLEGLANDGATQVEPGHGLTGTTPLHAVEDLVEVPAVAYVSEVSHIWNGVAYVFGGGLYVDPVLGSAETQALVVAPGASVADAVPLHVSMPAPEAIDYYATISLDGAQGARVSVGDTVIFGFRPQAFVTRALTASISSVGSGNASVDGIWSASGAALLEPVYS